MYYINLEKSVERRDKMVEEFDGALPDGFKLVRWNATSHED
jgi:hypothetical protein